MMALIPLVLKYLPVLIQASQSIPQITTFIAGLHSILQRDRSWSEEQEAEFDAQTEAMRNDPAWKVTD